MCAANKFQWRFNAFTKFAARNKLINQKKEREKFFIFPISAFSFRLIN